MTNPGESEILARTLLQECGPAATAFAHARSMECLFYQDHPGLAHWDAVERRIRALRVAE